MGTHSQDDDDSFGGVVMGLMDKAARALPFLLGQTFFSKVIAAINFALLVRLLAPTDIGLIGLTGGYLGILTLLMIAPENIFLRDFIRIKDQLNEHISSFVLFGAVRGMVIFLLSLPIAMFILHEYSSLPGAFYFLLVAFATGMNALASPFREAFYASFRQARIAMVDLSINLFSLIALVWVFYSHELVAYGWIQVISSLLLVGAWYWTARTKINFRFIHGKEWLSRSIQSLKDFTFWNHLIGFSSR
ncbi:MAG: oligosaccharide flippase family protein, partial [archaeon]